MVAYRKCHFGTLRCKHLSHPATPAKSMPPHWSLTGSRRQHAVCSRFKVDAGSEEHSGIHWEPKHDPPLHTAMSQPVAGAASRERLEGFAKGVDCCDAADGRESRERQASNRRAAQGARPAGADNCIAASASNYSGSLPDCSNPEDQDPS
jgi:hypothetical protein